MIRILIDMYFSSGLTPSGFAPCMRRMCSALARFFLPIICLNFPSFTFHLFSHLLNVQVSSIRAKFSRRSPDGASDDYLADSDRNV